MHQNGSHKPRLHERDFSASTLIALGMKPTRQRLHKCAPNHTRTLRHSVSKLKVKVAFPREPNSLFFVFFDFSGGALRALRFLRAISVSNRLARRAFAARFLRAVLPCRHLRRLPRPNLRRVLTLTFCVYCLPEFRSHCVRRRMPQLRKGLAERRKHQSVV